MKGKDGKRREEGGKHKILGINQLSDRTYHISRVSFDTTLILSITYKHGPSTLGSYFANLDKSNGEDDIINQRRKDFPLHLFK